MEGKGNILYLGGFALPDKNAAAQRVLANSKLLSELGYSVTLVGLDFIAGNFIYEGFRCFNLKYPSSFSEWKRYLFSMRNYLSFINELKPKIVIAYNHPAIALRKLMLFCKSKGIRIISDCTEWYTPGGSFVHRIIKGWDTSYRMKKVHLSMDGVFSISRFLHEYYSSQGVRSLFLPPLVDVHSKKWQKSSFILTRGLVLTYAGSPGKKDSLDRLVRIMSGLTSDNNVRFVIVGMDENEFIRAYDYRQAIPNSIYFKGRLSHDETLQVLFSSDFQVFIREDNITTKAGFPTKFVESITAGVPVLTNYSSNIGDYLINGVNGYSIDSSSDATLRESLLRVISIPKGELNKMRESMDRTIFDYRRYLHQMRQFIKSL